VRGENRSDALSLDRDGFLRRACPTCDREFMWRAGARGEQRRSRSAKALFCPYCGIRSPLNSWWTKRQLEMARSQGLSRANLFGIDPARLSSGGEGRPEESDDMRRVEFSCHPDDPVKALRDWSKPLHCLICGELTR
jgi:hypothetical protein